MTIHLCIDDQPPRPVEFPAKCSYVPAPGSRLRIDHGIDAGILEVLEVHAVGGKVQVQATRVG